MSEATREKVRQRLNRFAEEGPGCTCFNLRKAARAVTKIYDQGMRQSGIRVTQLSMLMATMRLGPVTVTRLAKATVTDRTTLTRNLRLLEKQGLIRLTEGSDRREREVTLTDRGREAVARAYPKWKEAQERVAQNFGQERLHRLLSELRALVAASSSG
ncbi:MAG: winged helix-turn-helix transcriptional regulator [candidate division NC10 bacterium]|nr:winged helix-turn-helix transcriptional regulator [candidate division NC10 bacterium]MBI2457877.1 winged helix-turn-helix transcriptional regulator [candidate division NC10 bacterium]